VTDPSPADALDLIAAEAPGVEALEDDRSRSWSADGHVFAVRSGALMEFRLGTAIGAAARRTTDVTSSSRGPDWVTFRPDTLDDYTADRLRAWFAAAHRRASSGGEAP
jgi:hypothetical protein